jgi:hypothetical protein
MQLFHHPQKHPTNRSIPKLIVSALALLALVPALAYRARAPALEEVAIDAILEQAKGAIGSLYLP